MSDLSDLILGPAAALAEAIRTRQVSSQEIVQAYLERIAEVNPRLNAVVQLAPESALETARRADRALARGESWGLLHGVPFTVKDVFDTAGIVSAVGLEERRDIIPAQDAVVVARLKTAGAILLGKTNCPPGGGGGVTDNPVYGRTNNPYDLERTPGGSSGGEAALVAAGGTPFGLGSDSGGSLRVPAHFCGVATLKPTTGRVPNTGVFNHPGGLSDIRTQIGPLARRVSDLWPVFTLIAGMDGRDAGVIPMPLGNPRGVDLRRLRVAFYTDDGQAPPTPEIAATVRAAARALEGAVQTVDEHRPPDLEASRGITERYWGGGELPGGEYERLLSDWDAFRTTLLGFMDRWDVILTPADYRPASLHAGYDPWRFNYTLPYSLTGYPCAVVRAGTSPEGLPLGVQLVARPWREDVTLAAAAVVESASGGWQKPNV